MQFAINVGGQFIQRGAIAMAPGDEQLRDRWPLFHKIVFCHTLKPPLAGLEKNFHAR